MTPIEAICAHTANQIGRFALYRLLLDHCAWRVPRPEGAVLPTVMVADAAATPSAWAFSTQAAYIAATNVHTAAVIGSVTLTDRLDEMFVQNDPRVVQLVIDPESAVGLRIQT